MDLKKAKAFNARMGKPRHYPNHQNLSKGGMVDKRKHFAGGGETTLVNPTGGAVGGGTQQGGLIGGLTQQSEYSAQLAPTAQFNYAPTVGAASTGALNATPVNQAIGAEQVLAGQYGAIAAGQGPNPAQAALNEQTRKNIANTAALQAGQRGGAANAGLLARQIGQQGAETQQAAVGQGATLQAQQELAAMGAQGTLHGQIAGQGLGEQGVNANLYGTAANANASQNNTNVANYAMAQGLNQATAAANTEAANKTSGGLLGGIGSGLAAIFHEGGEVSHLAAGGPLSVDTSLPGAAPPVQGLPGPSLGVNTVLPMPEAPHIGGESAGSFVGKILEGEKSGKDDSTGINRLGGGLGSAVAAAFAKGGKVHPGPHKSHVANYLFADGGAVGDKVPALVSPQEVYLNPHQVKEVIERGADPIRIGHHFGGHDKVKRNSQKNDVIPVTLEDGGVVLPISVTTHKEASEKGRKFVEKAHAKRYMKKPRGI